MARAQRSFAWAAWAARFASFACAACLGASACSPPSTVEHAASVAAARRAGSLTPCDDFCAGVTNFAKVTPSLWRGAQPTAEGFENLEAAGVKTVVNLRGDHDDAPLLAGTRLEPVRIRTRPWRVDEDDLVAFLDVASDLGRAPVFVHCEKGRDRTGYCIAAYRMVVEGWSADDAIAEMEDFRFDPIWVGIEGALRRLDVAKLRARLAPGSAASAAAASAER